MRYQSYVSADTRRHGCTLGCCAFYSPALLNHCVRSYLWAALYGAAHGIAFDDELLYVSAMLHDIALTEAFDSHRMPFEEAGGELAWVFGMAAGWSADRAARAMEIIVLHMRDDVAATVDPESHLLQVATSWDVAGRRPEEFPVGREDGDTRRLSQAGVRQRVPGVLSKTRRDGSRAAPPPPRSPTMAAERIKANPLDG